MSAFPYGPESPFWYFLAHRTKTRAELDLGDLLHRLNNRADELGIPIVFSAPHAVAWGVLCRLFNDVQSRSSSLDRMAFSVMKIGFGHVFMPKSFVDTAFQRILQNIQEPAFPGRSRDDSVVDTFLANALKLVEEDSIDKGFDAQILAACLGDDQMHALGCQVCQPARGLWDEAVKEYASRRPGWLRRQFGDPNTWLFD